ncbi:hypothetical protein [Planococcus lenghuensis]|uniref:JAB domain-containing protein n=1 Tax=Planococcus lenghuensis TaxID=2213202 RepID=A0A1Q2L4E8_9BACL|nr:hypothetical protein [Planococcus lenghuensis]AQQ55335.1 hypothetical protein B0X71_19365 [Planococcus lenghuensis]
MEKKAAAAKNAPASKPADKKADAFTPDQETVIRYLGEQFPITDFFSPEEVVEGILVQKKDEDPVREPLTAEIVRKRLEKEFPELVKSHTDLVFIKNKNLIVPILKAKAKGCKEEALPYGNASFFPIPFPVMEQFITLAAQLKDLEIHADVYFHPEKGHFLDIPGQELSRYQVRVKEEAWSIAERVEDAIKLMEIHSHHGMAPLPSSLDNESERMPGMVYAIVGRITRWLPSITVRTFHKTEHRHVSLDPSDIFESPFQQLPDFDTSKVEVF